MNRHLGFIMIAAALAVPLAVPPGAAGAQTLQVEPRERLLSVSGEGKAHAAPDMALITLGVVSEERSAREALDANTASMSQILEALKAGGMEARDLQTSGFSVEPIYSQPPQNYDHSKPFQPEIVGYRVRNNLTVRIRDLDRVGAVLDEVITLGANSVSGPDFTVEDPKPLEDEARRAAVRDAVAKGGLYAEAAGVPLGPIFRIEEGFSRPPQPLQGAAFRMEAAMADVAVPIEGGELTFEAQVQVSWTLGE